MKALKKITELEKRYEKLQKEYSLTEQKMHSLKKEADMYPLYWTKSSKGGF